MSLSDETKRFMVAEANREEPVRLNTLEGLSDMADSWEARIVSVSLRISMPRLSSCARRNRD